MSGLLKTLSVTVLLAIAYCCFVYGSGSTDSDKWFTTILGGRDKDRKIELTALTIKVPGKSDVQVKDIESMIYLHSSLSMPDTSLVDFSKFGHSFRARLVSPDQDPVTFGFSIGLKRDCILLAYPINSSFSDPSYFKINLAPKIPEKLEAALKEVS